MAWWEGVDETRLLIAPVPGETGNGIGQMLSLRHPKSVPGETGNGIGQMLSLRHPKSGNTACYLLVNGLLQELHWFKQSYGSWFVGDYVCEDGSLYTATPVDPVFIFLPIFEEARMKKGDDPGKFRQLDEIVFISGYPGYQHLLSIAENAMQVLCDVKEIGSSKFFRLDDSKVLAWLYHKVCELKKTLSVLDKNYAARQEKDTLADAVSILGEYMKDEPWLKLLCNHLKLDLAEANRKAPDVEILSAVTESNPESQSVLQGKGSDKKSTRTGKQAKKAKVETESKNIKEMFSRASRRRN